MHDVGWIMTKDTGSEIHISELRARAQSALAQKTSDVKDISALSLEDLQELVQEFQVHQIELEMQNEELRTAQLALEDLKNRYQDLYDFAPVGYLTFNEKGLILEANLTAARLLGEERQSLTKMFLFSLSRSRLRGFLAPPPPRGL